MLKIVRSVITILLFYAVNLVIFGAIWLNASTNPWNLQAYICLTWVLAPIIFVVAASAKYGISSDWSVNGDLAWGEEWQDMALFVLILPGWPLVLLIGLFAYGIEALVS